MSTRKYRKTHTAVRGLILFALEDGEGVSLSNLIVVIRDVEGFDFFGSFG